MILISFGTRPEYIKIKPLVLELQRHNIEHCLLFVGQHTDLLAENDITARIIKINNQENRLDDIVKSVLNQGQVFNGVSHVMVQGDTASAYAVGLSSFHRNIPVIHLEAGLRTYDKRNPFPEEFYRQSLSKIADYHLCPTSTAAENLLQERTEGLIRVVGNTVLDNLVNIEPSESNVVLVTMHRRENLSLMGEWFKQIDDLAKKHADLDFILPLHPNPKIQKFKNYFKHVKVISPVPYDEFSKMISTCKMAITDSGGIQEETSYFKKKCIVCRKTTERPEGLGVFSFLCESPEKLETIFHETLSHKLSGEEECPYGDGRASLRIVKIIKNRIIK